jgi:hypothetical protein
MEQCLEGRDFLPVPLGPRSFGVRHLGELLAGYCDKWGSARMPAEETDCVLTMLGLLHLRVKCVIPEELGGNYQPVVSVCGPGV